MSNDLFLMKLDKKGKVIIVPYPAKAWDKIILDKKKRRLKI